MTRHLLIDCDPGIDDAMAIYAALANDAVSLQGITTVFGNVTARQATRNVLRLLHPVRPMPSLRIGEGAEQPLIGHRLPRRAVHGHDGLGDVRLPAAPALRASEDSTRVITGLLQAGRLEQVVALGPLTNLAHAFATAPGLLRRLQSVLVMSGVVITEGSAATEFNLASDPSAARCLLEGAVPLRWVPFTVAASVLVPQQTVDRFQAMHPTSGLALVITKLLSYAARTRGLAGAVVPDAVACALAMDPSLGVWRARRLTVERGARLGRLRCEPGFANAQVCEAVHAERVLAMLWRLWTRLVRRDTVARRHAQRTTSH